MSILKMVVSALLLVSLVTVPAMADEKKEAKNPCGMMGEHGMMGGGMMGEGMMGGKMMKEHHQMMKETMEMMKEMMGILRNMSHTPGDAQKKRLD